MIPRCVTLYYTLVHEFVQTTLLFYNRLKPVLDDYSDLQSKNKDTQLTHGPKTSTFHPFCTHEPALLYRNYDVISGCSILNDKFVIMSAAVSQTG